MFGIAALLFWAWQSEIGRIVLLVVGGLVALDLAAGFLWGSLWEGLPRLRQRRQMQSPRQRELSNAGRGAGLLALLALALLLVGWPRITEFLTAARLSPDWEHGGALLAAAAVAAVGLITFFTGANKALRSAGERETRLIAWALFRLALGAALWWGFHHPPADVAAWVFLARALLPYCEIIVMVPALWLAVTGGTKLFLILWGGHRAHRLLDRILTQRNAPLVPARARRWPFSR